jgi:signal peptidase
MILLFLAFYVVSGKIAQSKGKTPIFGLYTAVGDSMEPTISKYDILLIMKKNINELKVGDIITFYPSDNIFSTVTITHRIESIENIDGTTKFITKGDGNETKDANMVELEDVLGKIIVIIPKIGLIQNYVAEHGPWIFLLLIPSVAFIISITTRGITLLKAKKQRDDISDF